MANGHWWGTDDEWRFAEAPLIQVDPVLAEFAAEFGVVLTKNGKGWPDRSLTWGNGVNRLIHLFLMDAKAHTFNLWLCVYEDREGKRYWKQDLLVATRPISEFQDRLPELLREGRSIIERWAEGELDFATVLAKV
jgi:hypothetical protein